jgi:hypothetical protein
MQNRKCIGLLGLAALAFGLVLTGCESPSSSNDPIVEPPEPTTFTIKFDLGGIDGTPPESIITVKYRETITLPDITAPEGETFQGWRSNTSIEFNGSTWGYGHEFHADETVTTYGGCTFTAIWKDKYTITFDLGEVDGTPPESMTVVGGTAITLPSVDAPEDKTFWDWYCSEYINSVGKRYFSAGESFVVSGNYTFTAEWHDKCNITFSLGDVSGTPPGNMTVEYGTTITLPEVTAPEGKVFQGWRSTNYLSGKYDFSAGESVTINNSNTFTARWVNKKYAQEGIYVSLISFAGNASVHRDNNNDFIFLDSSGRNVLSRMLNNYQKASAAGTALFYGVHKGLANLTANEGEFLTDISSVNLITFTDGLDNGSFLASTTDPIEGKKDVMSGTYATYVHGEIGSRKINGMPITAYSVGVKGSDVTDDTQFATNLGNIASQGNVHEITNFDELETVFTDIADTLTFASHFSMTTTGNDPGTVIRMTFDVTGSSSADAAASSKYIEGTLAYSDGVWTLTNVTYRGGITSDAGNGATIIGTVSSSNVSFLFRNIDYGDDAVTAPQQWTKAVGSSAWQINSEYGASGSTSTSPVLIQLVLDASTSLNDAQIGQIRAAVNRFIDSLYNRVYGGSN